jgi:DNA-binding PadR family transcriptional regulator
VEAPVSVRLGLLAILDQGSCYGYQLRGELDRRTGALGPVNVGQIYNTLDRLVRDKFVRTIDAGGAATSQSTHYEITESGRAEVRAWFSTANTPAVAGEELAAKIALATTLPGVDAASVVRIQRIATQRFLVSLGALQEAKSPQELAHAVIITERLEAAGGELRFLNELERMLAAAGERGIEAVPLSTEVPKRGRPARA